MRNIPYKLYLVYYWNEEKKKHVSVKYTAKNREEALHFFEIWKQYQTTHPKVDTFVALDDLTMIADPSVRKRYCTKEYYERIKEFIEWLERTKNYE